MPKAFEEFEPTDIECAYLAGVVDSDGCVIVTKHKKKHPNGKIKTVTYSARLDICQSNRADLKKLQKIWGGKITKAMRSRHLIWNGQNALPILQRIFPYIKFKQEQVSLTMYFLDTISKGSGYHHGIDKEAQCSIFYKLRALKRLKYA